MSGPFGSSQWMYSTGGGFYPYEIGQSLRFNDGDSAYLATTVSTASSTYTLSLWLKRGVITSSDYQYIFSSGVAGLAIGSTVGDTDKFYTYNGATITATPSVYRDPSAWYHLLLSVASNTGTIYVNGESVLTGAPCASLSTTANATRLGHYGGGGAFYFDGYMAEVNFIDGSALTPSSFGELKSDIWIPKAYTGSYGTNGSYLTFVDNSAIGDDLSGNGNDWTPTNLASTDVMLDSPTNNFATWNPLENTGTTLSEGNLSFSGGATSLCGGTIAVSSDKWYWEFQLRSSVGPSNPFILAWVSAGDTRTHAPYKQGVFIYSDSTANSNLSHYQGGSLIQSIAIPAAMQGFAIGDIIQFAYDADTGKVWIGVDDTWADNSGGTTGDPSTGSNPTFTLSDATLPMTALKEHAGVAWSGIANFGQDSSFAGTKTAQGNTDGNGVGDFYYAPPSGCLALCTANLPAPAIDPAVDDVPADYFNTVLYTGTGAALSVTGVGFQPDFLWLKTRSAVNNHGLSDAVRGASQRLYSNLTNAENAFSGVTSFDADGFTVDGLIGTSGSSGVTYVAWNWLAGNGTSSNTDGSITSTVSVNQKAGFSIVGWTGNGIAGATVGHGLGVAPSVIIVKDRDAAKNWNTYHKSIGATNTILLNFDNASTANDNFYNTAPTNAVWANHAGDPAFGSQQNINGNDYISYCFAEVDGFSKFGSYTGNGSANGPFVYCGFRPAFIMVKRTNTTGNWTILDNSREGYNVDNDPLYPNLSNAEGTTDLADLLSNGFKLRSTDASVNASGGTYIFAAFAEQPFKFSNAR